MLSEGLLFGQVAGLVTAFLAGFKVFAVIYAVLVCIAVFVSLIGRAMTSLIVAALSGALAFLVPLAFWGWSELGSLALAVASSLLFGRLVYFMMSTPEERRDMVAVALRLRVD